MGVSGVLGHAVHGADQFPRHIHMPASRLSSIAYVIEIRTLSEPHRAAVGLASRSGLAQAVNTVRPEGQRHY